MAPPSLLPNFPGIRPPSGFDNVGTLSDITHNFLSDAEIIFMSRRVNLEVVLFFS